MTGRLAFTRNLLAVLSATAWFFSCQMTYAQLIPNSIKTGTVETCKGSVNVTVESREFQLETQSSPQNGGAIHVSMLYDPDSKLFWWHTDAVAAASVRRQQGIPTLLPPGGVVCLANSRFVLFWNGEFSGNYIYVLESEERYSSMDEGQAHVLHVLREEPPFMWKDKRIDFPGLPKDFVFSKANTAIKVGPKLREVSRVDSEWHIVEEGPNGGSALIVLNDKYEVLKTTLSTSK